MAMPLTLVEPSGFSFGDVNAALKAAGQAPLAIN